MRYINVNQEAELPDISRFAPFKAVVAVEDRVGRDRQAEISAWLVEMGCRYVMSCGDDCDSWSETVRNANLKGMTIGDLEARDFVMVTAHPREPLKTVFWFAKNAARHPEVAFREFLVIHLAETGRAGEYEAVFQKA
jgi:hypothetical protein